MNQTKRQGDLDPARIFAVLGLVFGVILLLLTPPFQVADEDEHFCRAYQISECRFIEQRSDTGIVGGYLPRSVEAAYRNRTIMPLGDRIQTKYRVSEIVPMLRLPLAPQDRTFVLFQDAAMYSPVPYFPQVVGVLIGRLLGLPALFIFYLGRLSNLIIWILIVYFAIRTTPVFKWVFFLLALMPKSMYQAASVSVDAFTIAVSFLTIATILNFAFAARSRIRPTEWAWLFVISFVLALSKQAYFLIVFMYLIIPIRRVGSRTKYFGLFGILVFLVCAAIAVWMSLVWSLYAFPLPDCDPGKQLAFIFSHPVEYVIILLRTVKYLGLMSGFLGALGLRAVVLPEMLVWANFILLLVVALVDWREDIEIFLWQKTVMGGIAASTTLLIFTVGYLDWTPVGHNIVRSLMARYFIPIAPLALLLLYRVRTRFRPTAVAATAAILLWTVYCVAQRYYW